MSRCTAFAITLCYIALRCCTCISGPCEFTLYPVPFEEVTYTTPNSVCIYPDGLTSLSDAALGNLSINLDRLQELSWNDGQYYFYEWDESGMLLGDNLSSLRLCGLSDAYLIHSGEAYAYAGVPIYGGGHSAIDASGQPMASCIVHWAPSECGTKTMEVYFNSPDITGDLVVDICDTVLFARDMKGSYNYRSDFNYDGKIDGLDTVLYCAGLGARCP